MRRYIATGVEAHPAGSTNRGLHISVCEPHATRSDAIKVRRMKCRVARAAEVIKPQLVIHDKEDVHGASELEADQLSPPIVRQALV